MIKINCKECGKEILTFPCRIGRKKYCSPTCRGKNNPEIFKNGHIGLKKSKGIQKHSSGYVMIYIPEHPYASVRNTVLEHRLVMEKHIGRTLLPEEVVHHINGVKDDNRIENLQLFSSQKEHMLIGHKNDK